MPPPNRHTTKQTKTWQRNINNRLPIFGVWIRRKTARELAEVIQRDQDSEATRILAEAMSKTTDEALIGIANSCLLTPLSQSCLDQVWGVWAKTRNPLLHNMLRKQLQTASKPIETKVLSALFLGNYDEISEGKSLIVGPLIEACRDPDPEIAKRAKYSLGLLKKQETINALCSVWAKNRDPYLEKVIQKHQYYATEPADNSILITLLLDKPDLLHNLGPDQVDTLVQACRDTHPSIPDRAIRALSTLNDQAARDEVCKRGIQLNDPTSLTAAVNGNYLPSTPDLRAAFLFLTNRLEEYNSLDFDQSLMRMFYGSATPDLRQRIIRQVQSSGRVEYLTIFAGENYCSDVKSLNDKEIVPLIHMLSEGQEWGRIWKLVQELPLKWSIHCLNCLLENTWQPECDNERMVFTELAKYSRLEINFDRTQISKILPLGISRARLKVSGRINDIAFSPKGSILAIATGQRKAVLWDYQKGSIHKVLDGYNHSVGKVAFTSNGLLLSAERTNGNDTCDIYAWDDGQGYWVGSHKGSVTALIGLENDQAVSTGHDQKIFIWDLNRRQMIYQKECSFWPRNACSTAEGTLLALLHDGVKLVELPTLGEIEKKDLLPSQRSSKLNGKGIALSATFDTPGRVLFIGKYNGQVLAYPITEKGIHPKIKRLQNHTGQVRGLVYHPIHSLVISGGYEGIINITRWPSMEAMGQLSTEGKKLTSLQLSQDGSFLAVGNSDTTTTLWDLRILEIPAMIELPIAQIVPNSLEVIDYLSEDTRIPVSMRNCLKYLQIVLKFRFRYDVQVDELQLIQPGEYDILLEDLSS